MHRMYVTVASTVTYRYRQILWLSQNQISFLIIKAVPYCRCYWPNNNLGLGFSTAPNHLRIMDKVLWCNFSDESFRSIGNWMMIITSGWCLWVAISSSRRDCWLLSFSITPEWILGLLLCISKHFQEISRLHVYISHDRRCMYMLFLIVNVVTIDDRTAAAFRANMRCARVWKRPPDVLVCDERNAHMGCMYVHRKCTMHTW